jgi:phosphatidylglycerol:prolipoprotein diacylglycerol transferase
MYPYLHLGPMTFGTFGLCGVLAYLFARRVFRADLVRHDLPKERAAIVFVVVTVAGVIGAKVYHVLENPASLLTDPVGKIFSGHGLAWIGGLLAGAATLALLARRYKMRVLEMFDLASPMAALAYAVGRVGCLMAGDGCYGLPTSLPWGMRFPNAVLPTLQYVHPTPIYEFIANVAISYYLWRFAARPRPLGAVFARYLIFTGAARFIVEFIRRNPGLYLGMSNAQVISLLCVLVGSALLLRIAAEHRASTHIALTARA